MGAERRRPLHTGLSELRGAAARTVDPAAAPREHAAVPDRVRDPAGQVEADDHEGHAATGKLQKAVCRLPGAISVLQAQHDTAVRVGGRRRRAAGHLFGPTVRCLARTASYPPCFPRKGTRAAKGAVVPRAGRGASRGPTDPAWVRPETRNRVSMHSTLQGARYTVPCAMGGIIAKVFGLALKVRG